MKEEKSKSKKQGNIYDRIFKENARELEKITGKIIDDMPISYDIEKDGFYIQGIQKGRKEGREEGREEGEETGIEKTLLVIKCLQEGKTLAETAKITALTLEQVKKIKKQIS